MTAASYAIPSQPMVLNHHSSVVPAWFGDYDEDTREFNQIDAIAASGDCFITLATRLDKIAQGLPQDSAEQIEIENVVKTLFYLQDNWKLTGKDREG